VGEIKPFPQKPPEPISEEQEEREFEEACRSAQRSRETRAASKETSTEEVQSPRRRGPSKRMQLADFPFKRLPDLWIEKLAQAQYKSTLKLAIYLLVLDWEERGKPIELTSARLAKSGISPDERKYAFREVESLGVARLERRHSQSPIATLIKS
jgi:hypothetical protein